MVVVSLFFVIACNKDDRSQVEKFHESVQLNMSYAEVRDIMGDPIIGFNYEVWHYSVKSKRSSELLVVQFESGKVIGKSVFER